MLSTAPCSVFRSDQAVPLCGVEPAGRETDRRRGHRQPVGDRRRADAVVAEVIRNDPGRKRQKGDAAQHRDVREQEDAVGVADHHEERVVVDPPDPDDQERDGVGGVLRPRVRQRSAERTARRDHGDVDDQQRGGDREDAVREDLEPGGLHGARSDQPRRRSREAIRLKPTARSGWWPTARAALLSPV
jgi:hypothetical protein